MASEVVSLDELPAPTTSLDQLKEDISRHGIAFHEEFLSPETRRALLERVTEQAELEVEQGVAQTSPTGTASELEFSGAGSANAPLQVVSFLPNKGTEFIELAADERLLALCRHAFSNVPFYVAQVSATIVRNGASGQVIHTDQQAWPFLTPMPVMLNVAVALTDFTPDMGSTRFVPGTKDSPPPRIGKDEKSGAVVNLDPVETKAPSLKAGAAAIWDARVWHGQGTSVSQDERIVILITYVLHFVRAQDDFPALLHDDVYSTLTEDQRRLLGFEVHYEYAGRIAPRSPEDTRRNTNFVYPFVPELRRGGGKKAVPVEGMKIAHPDEMASIV